MDGGERDPGVAERLSRALVGPGEGRGSWSGLARLARRAWQERARRRRVTIQGSLREAGARAAEAVPVRLVDISASGVRLRIPRRARLDVMRADEMYLNVTLESPEEAQVLGLYVRFVRVAATEDRYAELAFRFAHPSDETQRKLDRIHAHYFGDW